MQPNGLPISALGIEPAINRHPLTVTPETPIIEVLALMTSLRSSCALPDQNTKTDNGKPYLPLISSVHQKILEPTQIVEGCVLVMEGSQLVGMFTERDIITLTAARTSLIGIKIADVVVKSAIALKQSATNDIFTVLSLFRQHGIRHLPIIDDSGQVVGTISNDSIRKAMQPVNLLTRLRYVKDVMTHQVIHAPVSASVLDLAQLMARQRISCVVITEERDIDSLHPQSLIPVGIITERDVVQFQSLELDLSKIPAQDVMSTPLFSLRPSDSLWTAHQEMQQRLVRRLVVTGEQGELLGIISQTSLLQVLNPADMYGVIEVLQQAVDEHTKALQETNERLRLEIVERQRAEEALQQAHDDLKRQVEERTAELTKANAQLKQDIIERQKVEAALRESEGQSRTQSQQLEHTLHALQNTQAQLIQTEKMSSLGQLVAGIAHEINNPINFIYGNLTYADQYIKDILQIIQLYSQHYPQPAAQIQAQIEATDLEFTKTDLPRLLGSMKVGADRIRDLVLSLRNFSRLDEAEMKSVNIHEGIDSTLLILQNQLKAKAGRLEIQIIKEYGNLPQVECHAGQLNQVFMNIISNAIDVLTMGRNSGFTPGQDVAQLAVPIIRIRTEIQGENQVAIRITDNGPGMTEQVYQQLFNPFFTTKPVGKGTGLGLSISYQIVVEKHRGKLRCISAPGMGAEFAIEIPIWQSNYSPELAIASSK